MKVILAAAISADGFIGPEPGMRSFEWTSKEDRSLVVNLSKEMGVIVMGSKTFSTFQIKRAPPGRRLLIYTSNPASVSGENVETTDEDPATLVRRLEQEGANGLIVEGGATIYKLYLESGVVDEVYLTVEPILFGSGTPLLNGEIAVQLSLIEQRKLNDNTVLLHYAVQR
jgi:dihydrofolate reductase